MARTANVVSVAEDTAINEAFYGAHEPALDKPLGHLLNWYNAMRSDKDAIAYLVEYLDGRPEDIERLKLVPGEWTPRTAAWLGRLSSRGYQLTVHNAQSIEAGLKRAFTHVDDTVRLEDQNKFVPNVQQRIRDKASDYIGEMNGMLDDEVDPEKINEWLRGAYPSLPVVRRMIEKLSPSVEELTLVLEGNDDELVDAYRGVDVETQHDRYAKTLEYLQVFAGDIKTTKPRKKRAVNIDKVLSKFKYAKRNDEYNLVSIDPRKVLGAHELWIFNTKYLTLSVLRGSGLGIKGTSITGYDESKSQSKRIGRKTTETLKTVLTGGRVALRQLVDQPLKTNRTSEDTILLRAL